MKRISRKNMKIVAATAMTIFSLFAALSGVYAWFVSKMNEANDLDIFEVKKVGNGATSIAVHDFYGFAEDGTTYGFNPTANHTITFNENGGTDTGAFTMGTFSLEDTHHPVMFLLGVNGEPVSVNLITNRPYLALPKPGGDCTVFATYSALNVAANKIAANDGLYFEVTNDENQYAYYNDGNSNHRVTTRYIYHHDSQEFEMVWTNLGQLDNALSSVIEAHYVLFSDDPTDTSGSHQTVSSSYLRTSGVAKSGETYYTRSGDGTSQSPYTYTVDSSITTGAELGTNHYIQKTYVPVSSNFGNSASFVSFTNDTPNFEGKATVYAGPTANYTHVGIIIDYDLDSLEFIYSYFLGHNYLNDGLGFKCDWNMEV